MAVSFVVTNDAFEALNAASNNRLEGKRRPDGSWQIAIADETFTRLKSCVKIGETISDTIERLVGFSQGRKAN